MTAHTVLWVGFGCKIMCPKVLQYFVLEGVLVHMHQLLFPKGPENTSENIFKLDVNADYTKYSWFV